MNELQALRGRYGRSATFALAYGAGDNILEKQIKGSSQRIIKKKLKKAHSLGESINYVFGIDRGETFTLKLKYKKGWNKGKTYGKVFRVKDKTVYCTIIKHRHRDVYYNKIENLGWL